MGSEMCIRDRTLTLTLTLTLTRCCRACSRTWAGTASCLARRRASGGPACWREWPPGGATARQLGLYSDGCGPARCRAALSARERRREPGPPRAATMPPRGGESHRRRAPALEASPWQHPGYSRRASRPTSCPLRSKCCSSPGGEGTSSTHSCCRRCSHSRTPHGYRSSARHFLASQSLCRGYRASKLKF